MPSKRERFNQWWVEHQRAAAGDDAAATRYQALADQHPERRAEYLAARDASVASAAANRVAMQQRLAGTYKPTRGERVLAQHGLG